MEKVAKPSRQGTTTATKTRGRTIPDRVASGSGKVRVIIPSFALVTIHATVYDQGKSKAAPSDEKDEDGRENSDSERENQGNGGSRATTPEAESNADEDEAEKGSGESTDDDDDDDDEHNSEEEDVEEEDIEEDEEEEDEDEDDVLLQAEEQVVVSPEISRRARCAIDSPTGGLSSSSQGGHPVQGKVDLQRPRGLCPSNQTF